MTCEKAQTLRERLHSTFYREIREVLIHPVVRQMRSYRHHGSTDCYQHCMNVAYYSYLFCSLMRWDARAAARAGMLHDLYLYDWHTYARETGEHFHGLTHPKRALHNAELYFELTDREKDIIRKHMWPITVALPKYREAYVVMVADKICGMCEVTHHFEHRLRHWAARAWPVQSRHR